jgi:hypothetical protein
MELDANNTRLLLTEPSGDLNYTKLFSFDYKSKAWSYEEFAGNFLGKKQITRGFTYDTWISAAPYDYDTGLGVFPDHTYDGMATTDSGNEIIYVGKGSSLFYYGGTTITSDAPSGTAISTRIESGDFDYGEPDRERKHLRLSLKLKTPLLQDLLFILRVSDDSGTTWRDVTAAGRPLRIPAGKRENYVNFRSRGSTFRFRLESSSVCGSYLIQEIVLRAIGAGVEGHLVSNR